VFSAFISEEISLSLWNYQDGENCDNIMYSSAVHFFAGVSRRHGWNAEGKKIEGTINWKVFLVSVRLNI